MPASIDYRAVIRDIEDKRRQFNARFDAAIAAIQQVQSMERGGQLNLPDVHDHEMTPSYALPYANMQMVDAAKAHLRSVGGAVPNVALATALERGGFPHKSKNFANTLNSVLWRRHKDKGDIRKSAGGWELVSE